MEGSTEAGVEHILRIIAVIAHLSLEQRLHGVGTEREADGVELNAGSYQRVETDGTVDATLRRERHVYKGVLIVVTEMTYGTGEDVLLSCVQIERELRQTFAQTQLIDVSLLLLLHGFVVGACKTVYDVLYGSVSVHLQGEVAAGYGGMGGVWSGEDVQRNALRSVSTGRIAHDNVADDAACRMVVLKIAVKLDVGNERCGERTLRKTYLIEVGIEEVAGKPCVQAAVADKRAQVDDAVEERIATVEDSLTHTVAYGGIELHIGKVVTGIAEMAYASLGFHPRTSREEVESGSFRSQLAGERLNGKVRKEVGEAQRVGSQACTISIALHIEAGVALDAASTLRSREISGIARAVRMEISLQGYATRNAERTRKRGGEECGDEGDVVGMGICSDGGVQTLDVRKILHLSACHKREGTGQRHLQGVYLHCLHIAVNRSLNGERRRRPLPKEVLRHKTKE